MSVSIPALAILAVVLMGTSALWSNPHRALNLVLFSVAIHVALWLYCVQLVVVNEEGPFWVRLASAVGGFIPVHLWVLKEAGLSEDGLWPQIRRRLVRWLAVPAAMALLCATPFFVQATGPHTSSFGPAYFVYVAGFLVVCILLCRETMLQARARTGITRLELQIMLLAGSVTVIAVGLLLVVREVLGVLWPLELQPLVIVVLYVAMVVAISTPRVFDAGQLVRVVVHKGLVLVMAAAIGFGVEDGLLGMTLPPAVARFVALAAALSVMALLNRSLQRLFRFYPEATAARQAMFAAARRESRGEKLVSSFEVVLKRWGQSDRAVVLTGTKDGSVWVGGLDVDATVRSALRGMRWATPERLRRERPTPERDAVARFLQRQGLAVCVVIEGPTLTVLAGVGPTVTRVPFTYPRVTQLLELASIMENALERAHFSQKIQHTEQLATVGLLGASMAHEIRNPLVTIKTFVQLLPSHYQDPAFREKFFRLIGDEVNRIDRLTEQLLDLAAPRVYSAGPVELHPVLRGTLDLVAAKAAHKNVQLVANLNATPDTVFTDPGAAKQVMLNLCFNAIQALETKEDGPRCLWVETRNAGPGVEVAVTDNGPGIAPELLPRLFQPFQTTKSSGFGLGLAICSDILTNLNASIAADPPAPGRGATFRVTFPCPPSSS